MEAEVLALGEALVQAVHAEQRTRGAPRGTATSSQLASSVPGCLKSSRPKDSVREPSCGRVIGLETAPERVAFSGGSSFDEWTRRELARERMSARVGHIEGSKLALLIDRIQYRSGLPQIYGSQVFIKYGPNGRHVDWQVENVEDIDLRRSKMSMEPICKYLARIPKVRPEQVLKRCGSPATVAND
ncbi:MAG TPA: hypothetical protein VGF12_06350 [Roseateles sp.]|uniref:hypothetical protein n=1 Tax=Roseateles sp. TaxID=1971397 RepID=UPI002EDA77E2